MPEDAGEPGVASEALVPLRGVELFVRRFGSGPAAVVLHGGPGAHHDYLLPAFDALADGRELVYYDQRGGGRSPVARDVPVGWTEQVADLEALRECWRLERLTVVGYSWGGLLALLYALEHPGRVERLALVSPAPTWRGARERFERRFAERNVDPSFQEARRELRESGLRERDPAAFQQRIFELSVAPYFFDPARATELTPFRVTGRTQQEVWHSLGDYDLRPRLPELRGVPSLVLHGEDDPIPIDAARAAAELLGAEFRAVRRCGHVPYVEAFGVFREVVGRFLRPAIFPV
ncbi:MAG: alpha/beta fold hydrolase [Gemmatimonadales bacterium]|nr:alpha/beta fold hydrolase [Gemmatimonadales bacterium]